MVKLINFFIYFHFHSISFNLISILILKKNFDINDKRAIRRSPLAKKIFETDGVRNVFFGKDFITVTKQPTETWKILKTLIFSAILDHFASGEPVVVDEPKVSDTQILEDDSEVIFLFYFIVLFSFNFL